MGIIIIIPPPLHLASECQSLRKCCKLPLLVIAKTAVEGRLRIRQPRERGSHASQAFSALATFNHIHAKYPDYEYHEATLNPTNPAHHALDWEADVINYLRDHRDKQQSEDQVRRGGSELDERATAERTERETLLRGAAGLLSGATDVPLLSPSAPHRMVAEGVAWKVSRPSPREDRSRRRRPGPWAASGCAAAAL